MTSVQWTALWGIALSLAGVLVLFRYGMPFRVERRGASYILREETDFDALAVERRYKILGYVGLSLIVFGSGLQAASIILS